ncbi:MAG: branched-chain amino acid ABC transporter permease [Leucobacter sp.]
MLTSTLIEAISVGAMYAVIALGVALIVGVGRIMNFAHGELIMIAGYGVALTSAVAWPAAVALAIVCAILAAAAMELGVFRWARKADPTTLLIIAFALSQFIQALTMMLFGATAVSTSFGVALSERIDLLGLSVSKLTLVTLGAALALLAFFSFVLLRTTFGLRLRAASEDFVMARMVGVRVNRTILGAFLLSGLAAGVGGVLLMAQVGSVTPTFGVQPLLIAFVAMIIGGLGSLPGAVVGGLMIGIVSMFLQSYLPPEIAGLRDSFVYALVIAILLFRPQGLFKGTQIGERI